MKKINILILVVLFFALIGCNLDNVKEETKQNQTSQNQTSQNQTSENETSQVSTSQISTSENEGGYKEISYSENEAVSNYVNYMLPGLLKNFLMKDSIRELISREVVDNSLILGIPSDVNEEEFNNYIKRIGDSHEFAIKKDIFSDFTNIDISKYIIEVVKGTLEKIDYIDKVIESVNDLIVSDAGLQIRNIGKLSVKEKDGNTEIKVANLNLQTMINYLRKYENEKVYEYNSETKKIIVKTIKEFIFAKNSKGEENFISKLINHLYNNGKNIEIYDTSLNIKNVLTAENYDIHSNHIMANVLEEFKGNNLIEFELKARVDGSEVKIVCISTVNTELQGKEKHYIQGKEVDVYLLDNNLKTTLKFYSDGISLNDIEGKIKSILGL